MIFIILIEFYILKLNIIIIIIFMLNYRYTDIRKTSNSDSFNIDSFRPSTKGRLLRGIA